MSTQICPPACGEFHSFAPGCQLYVAAHAPGEVWRDSSGQWRASCACKWQTEALPTLNEAEADALQHIGSRAETQEDR